MTASQRTTRQPRGSWLLTAPPKLQCAGNELEYDPLSGTLGLTITDDSRC